MDARLPTHLIVNAMIRRVQAEGGFATVIASGERDAGTMLIVLTQNGRGARLFERMPQLDGAWKWTLSREQDAENPQEFDEYIKRRKAQDPDLWIVELDIRDGERFIGDVDVRN